MACWSGISALDRDRSPPGVDGAAVSAWRPSSVTRAGRHDGARPGPRQPTAGQKRVADTAQRVRQGSGPVSGPDLGSSRRLVAAPGGLAHRRGVRRAGRSRARCRRATRGLSAGACGSRTRRAPAAGRSLTPALDHDALVTTRLFTTPLDRERWRVGAGYPHQHAIVDCGVCRLTPWAGQMPVAAAAQRVRRTNDPVTEQKPPRTREPAHAPGGGR
jgi:hypothetical protein